MNVTNPWWDATPLPMFDQSFPMLLASWAERGIAAEIMIQAATRKAYRTIWNGDERHFDAVVTALTGIGGHTILEQTGSVQCGLADGPDGGPSGLDDEERLVIMAWPDAVVRVVGVAGLSRVQVMACALGAERMDAIRTSVTEVLNAKIAPDLSRIRPMFVLVDTGDGLHIRELGPCGELLARGNYTQAQVEAFDQITANILSSDPDGRLVLLSGPPGSGKSHYVYGLMQALPTAVFVAVPPSMVKSLGDPSLLTAVLGCRRQLGRKAPLVFFVEDGDRTIAKRGDDNIDDLAALLQLGDGANGRTLNLHVIVTTNSGLEDVDRAVVRDARLAAKVMFDELTPDHAIEIWQRLLPGTDPPLLREATDRHTMRPAARAGSLTLAMLYKRARAAGWKPERP